MNTYRKGIPIFAFFIFLSIAILFRTFVESTHYCTPDSKHYLEVSNNFLHGLGFVGPKIMTSKAAQKPIQFGYPNTYEKQYFAIWPLAYPIGIITTASITHLHVMWASKIFNLLLLGIDFWLLYVLFGRYAQLSIFYFGSYTMIEVCTYTWSENLFIPLFLGFIIALKSLKKNKNLHFSSLTLFFSTLLGMCLTRYSAVIYHLSSVVVMGYFFYHQALKKAIGLFVGLALSSLLFISYLYVNYLKTGFITGLPRAATQVYDFWTLFGKFWLGMFNQLHLIKQCRFNGTADFVFYLILLTIQLVLIAYIVYQFQLHKYQFKFNNTCKLLLFNAIIYLAFLCYMTIQSTIDPFDYRTLLPFSFPVMLSILYTTEKKLRTQHAHKILWMIKAFFICAVLFNLPKQYLWGLL